MSMKLLFRLAPLWLVTMLGCSHAWPASPVVADELVRLDARQGSLSEGLALRGRTAYFGYAGSGQLVAIDIDRGTVTPFSSLPQPVAGKGFVTGLAVGGDTLYGALVSFVPEVQAGIYRVTQAGAPATLFAKHPEMAFPNGLAFDGAGILYVTDSAAGAVFRVSPTGETTKWLSDPLLQGNKDNCGPGQGVGVPFDIGANGIVLKDGALFVSNSDRGSIVRIPIGADGAPGTPALFAGPSCAELGGADGLAVAPDGALIVADNHLNKLMRVDDSGRVSTFLASPTLDFPTSLGFADGALYISNFAFLDNKNPGLLRIR